MHCDEAMGMSRWDRRSSDVCFVFHGLLRAPSHSGGLPPRVTLISSPKTEPPPHTHAWSLLRSSPKALAMAAHNLSACS
eukprot:6478601-Lingulodinium_polyedra.AAC.1